MKKIRNPYLGLEEQGYNCFACCPQNPYGLKMEFYEDGDDLVCIWKSGDNYQGWLKTLHGGIQATLMDELGGWLINRKLQTAGMTTQLTMKYRNQVMMSPSRSGDTSRKSKGISPSSRQPSVTRERSVRCAT